MTPSSQGQTRTITAFFDNRTDAEEAVQRLTRQESHGMQYG